MSYTAISLNRYVSIVTAIEMCQAPVGRVLEKGDGSLTIDYNGKRRVLRSKLSGINVGDYVQFSLDIAIDKIDEEEARMILGEMK